MLAAVLESVGKISLKKVEKPKPRPGEAVVAVMACGICQTDFSAYTGRREAKAPITLGHEISGIIDGLGEGVDGFMPQDEVVVNPNISCGRCRWCRIGLENHCPYGAVIGGEGHEEVWDGGFAEYVRVPARSLLKKPEGISFESAALTEPLAGSYKGLIKFGRLTIGEDVVIVGCGSMGLLLLLLAKAAGAGRIIGIDPVKARREKAMELGATAVIDPESEDPQRALKEMFPDGPDIVMEAAGTLEAASLAMRIAGRRTRVSMFGVIIPGEISISPKDIHFSEIEVNSSFSVTSEVMQKALDIMEKGVVDTSKIITHIFPLKDISLAFQSMMMPERVKIMIKPWD
jgi:threonine dehydrogenase-like Zn-dependent dehydrogenase